MKTTFTSRIVFKNSFWTGFDKFTSVFFQFIISLLLARYLFVTEVENYYIVVSFVSITYYLGKPIKYMGWTDYILRLGKREKTSLDGREIHESVVVRGKIGKLESPIYHFSYNSIEEHFKKAILYASLESKIQNKNEIKIDI